MPDASYKNLTEIARAHGVSQAAVTGWTKKGAWPSTLVRSAVDAFVADWVVPHRKGKQKRNAIARKSSAAAIGSTAPVMPIPLVPAIADPPVDVETATLEELERAIRRARHSDEAEKLSKQVRALKVVREIQDRDKSRIDATIARAEIRAVFHFFQTAMIGIPRAIAQSLEGLTTPDIEAVIEGRLVELLGELKRGLQNAIGIETESAVVGGSAGEPGGTREANPEPMGGAISGSDAATIVSAGQVE